MGSDTRIRYRSLLQESIDKAEKCLQDTIATTVTSLPVNLPSRLISLELLATTPNQQADLKIGGSSRDSRVEMVQDVQDQGPRLEGEDPSRPPTNGDSEREDQNLAGAIVDGVKQHNGAVQRVKSLLLCFSLHFSVLVHKTRSGLKQYRLSRCHQHRSHEVAFHLSFGKVRIFERLMSIYHLEVGFENGGKHTQISKKHVPISWCFDSIFAALRNFLAQARKRVCTSVNLTLHERGHSLFWFLLHF